MPCLFFKSVMIDAVESGFVEKLLDLLEHIGCDPVGQPSLTYSRLEAIAGYAMLSSLQYCRALLVQYSPQVQRNME
jgi:hypothetical protein